MKAHTSGFKQGLIELGRELRGIITYGNTTLEEEIYAITPHYEADLLKSVMKQLDLKLSVDIPLGTVINCQVGIKVGNNYEMLNYGNYVVYNSEKQEDTGTYKITCYDKLLYSMKQNEDLNVTYPISISNYLVALANKLGLTVATQTFYNSSLTIPSELYLGLDYTYRDILDEIAQATGSIICLNTNDEIELRYPTQTNDTIDEDFLKDVNVDFGQKYGVINSIVLSRSGESDNVYLRDEESVTENGLTEIKIVDNQIMNFNNRSDFLQGILDALDGLYYYINDFNSTGILYYEVGDLYNVQIGENTYQCLMLNDEVNVTTGIEEIVHTDMPEKSETDYSKADKTDMRINKTYLIVDKQNQQIESVVNNVTEQNNKISQITQTVDEINSKIQDIADITTYGESDRGLVELTGINQSEPIMIKVHPTTTNISYLYPRENLYPSDLQFLPDRKIRFTRTYEEDGETLTEDIDYELPDDLLRYSSEVYDEFYLNYDSHTCQVIKRCEYSGGENNIFNPEYLTSGTVSGVSNITKDELETFTIVSSTQGVVFDMAKKFDIIEGLTYKIKLGNLYNVGSNSNIKIEIKYYGDGDVLLDTVTSIGTDATIAYNDVPDVIYFKLKFTFLNRVAGQGFKFNVMMNTGTTILPFETYNVIVVQRPQEQTIDYPYPQILLGDGDYSISLLGYDYGYLYVRLMAQNIYTTQFATKAEVTSEINQSAQAIDLSVNQKLTNYSTTTEMNSAITVKANEINSVVSTKVGENEVISKINQSSESVKINAGKINLYGKTIDLTSDLIDIQSTNFTVDEDGNMSCQNANVSGTITSNNANITGGNIHLTADGTSNPAVLLDNSSGGSILMSPSYNNEPALSITGSNNVQVLVGANDGIQLVNNGRVLFTVNPNTGKIFTDNTIESSYIYNYDTVTNTANLYITSNGNFRRTTNTSSQRYKKDIKELSDTELNPEKLYNLKVTQFKYKKDYQPNKEDARYDTTLIGFIAEDVAKIYPIAADYNEKGEVENWNERYMIPAMLKLIQEQHIEIEQMKKEIEELKGGK